jgi:hypothetical protein
MALMAVKVVRVLMEGWRRCLVLMQLLEHCLLPPELLLLQSLVKLLQTQLAAVQVSVAVLGCLCLWSASCLASVQSPQPLLLQ